MKLFSTSTAVLCLASAADGFVVAPPSSRASVAASGRQCTRMVSPLPAAAAAASAGASSLTTVLQSSVVPLIAAAGGVAEPGTVDAPGWVLPAGAVAVILTAGLIPLLLKPGDDAARDMQERDEGLWEQNKK
ncbi:unnamed protein product [Ectocarpus sp. 8 AP-2014]